MTLEVGQIWCYVNGKSFVIDSIGNNGTGLCMLKSIPEGLSYNYSIKLAESKAWTFQGYVEKEPESDLPDPESFEVIEI